MTDCQCGHNRCPNCNWNYRLSGDPSNQGPLLHARNDAEDVQVSHSEHVQGEQVQTAVPLVVITEPKCLDVDMANGGGRPERRGKWCPNDR